MCWRALHHTVKVIIPCAHYHRPFRSFRDPLSPANKDLQVTCTFSAPSRDGLLNQPGSPAGKARTLLSGASCPECNSMKGLLCGRYGRGIPLIHWSDAVSRASEAHIMTSHLRNCCPHPSFPDHRKCLCISVWLGIWICTIAHDFLSHRQLSRSVACEQIHELDILPAGTCRVPWRSCAMLSRRWDEEMWGVLAW